MTVETLSPTEFASAERAGHEDLQRQINLFNTRPEFATMLDAVSELVMVLNSQRQIVYGNTRLAAMFGLQTVTEVYGLRPGELMGCINADNHSGGCGTSEACTQCGAALAILRSLDDMPTTGECSILTTDHSALDLSVMGTPLGIKEEIFSVFAVRDISHETRRLALERTFFHDILNSAGGLLGYAEMMDGIGPAEMIELEIPQTIGRLANQLIDEISAQRLIVQAEKNQIVADSSEVDPQVLMDEVFRLYQHHQVAEDRHLSLEKGAAPATFLSDHTLLGRVLGNMTKNALEASRPGQTVTLGWVLGPDHITFSVHNPNHIERNVQLQLFQRTFSTKGRGRGLGTYSMKLFGEKYLGGKVWFDTDANTGTTFHLQVPLKGC